MKLVDKYPHGCFSWIDLASTNAAEAKSFYSQLFGWDAVDMPIPGGGVYTMFQIDGNDVSAVNQLGDEFIQQGMRSVWNSYINVDDVDTTTQKAADAGAQVVEAPFDVGDSGRMSLVQDPTGAMVAFWQANSHIGASVVNQPGSLVWNELATRDPEAARAFYTSVLGWDHQYDDKMNYHVFMNDGRMAAGMMEMDEKWGDIPPHWMIYIAVDNVESVVEKAGSMGGTVHVPPTEISGTGKFSTLSDPHGGSFSVINMENVDPPPGH